MLLNKDFGVEGKQRWDFSIGNDMEQVMTLSDAITEYGKKVSLDPRMLNTLALCIEEMAGNVVKHAFSPGESSLSDQFEYRRTIGLNNLIIVVNKKYEGSGKGSGL